MASMKMGSPYNKRQRKIKTIKVIAKPQYTKSVDRHTQGVQEAVLLVQFVHAHSLIVIPRTRASQPPLLPFYYAYSRCKPNHHLKWLYPQVLAALLSID